MSKHTPAPWSVDWDGEDLWNNHIVCSEGRICFMAHSGPERQDEFDANAQLISAAPDLLNALKAMTEEWVDYMTINHLGDPWTKHNMKLAHAAITKAEAKR